MSLNTFPSIANAFSGLAGDFLSSARELPGAATKALANRNDGLYAGLLDVEANLEKCLVSLPDGQKIWGWEYEALEQLAMDNRKGVEKNILGRIEVEKLLSRDKIEVEGGSIVKADFDSTGLHDVSALSHLTSLKELSLNNNQIGNLGPISILKELKILSARHNKIEDISSLANLLKLEDLHLDGNQVRDFSPLIELPKLSFVEASGKPLSSENCKIVDELEAREGLDVYVY